MSKFVAERSIRDGATEKRRQDAGATGALPAAALAVLNPRRRHKFLQDVASVCSNGEVGGLPGGEATGDFGYAIEASSLQ